MGNIEKSKKRPPLAPRQKKVAQPKAPKEAKEPVERDLKDQIVLAIAVVALCVVTYFLFFAPSLSWLRNGVKVGSIEVKGIGRRRHSANLNWSDIKNSNPVYMRDVIYIPKDAEAELILDNKKRIRIPPDTMFQIDESTIENLEITLLDAPTPPQLPTYAKNEKAANNYLNDLKPLELRLAELKKKTADRVFSPVDLTQIHRLRPPSDLALNEFSDYTIRLVRPPLNKYNLPKNRWMIMTWTKVPFKDVVYTLQLSKDPDLKHVLYHSSKTNQILIQFDEAQTFYWRVKAVRNRAEIFSEMGQFTMSAEGGLLNQQVSLREVGGKSNNNPVDIATDVKFNHIVKSVIASEPKCPTEGLSRGSYFCRVKSPTGSSIVKSYVFTVK